MYVVGGGGGGGAQNWAHNPNAMATPMQRLCEAAVAEAASGTVCVYHDNDRADIVVSNTVTGTDAAHCAAIKAAWGRLDDLAHDVRWCAGTAVKGLAVEHVGKGTATAYRLIRIAADLASEDLKRAAAERPASAHETEAYKALLKAVFKAIGTKVGRRSSIAFSTGEYIATSSGTMTYNPDVGVNIKNTAYAPIDRDHMDPDHRARFDATWAEIRALAVRAAEQGAETTIRIGRPLGDSEYFNLHQDTFLCASYYPPREDAPKRSAAEDEAPPAKRPASC